MKNEPLDAGLYLVATPIGSARDITLRALDVIRAAQILVAEDTRTARRLMACHGIRLGDRKLISYNDHNGSRQREKILEWLRRGQPIALLSDAGTPLIADPGFQLAAAARSEGHKVVTIPGASAVIAALTLSGLPTDRFLFAGFAPKNGSKRRQMLEELANLQATLVVFESARRLPETLNVVAGIFGPLRQVAVCREMTKRFEEVWRGNAESVAARAAATPVKGEIVILIDRAGRQLPERERLYQDLGAALTSMTVRDAVAAVATAHAMPRSEIYRLAIEMQRRDHPEQ
ncbi:MAG: 16S rRNA (cytidine(1402)-2'-O)-methyltransferase [Rhodobacteraceae bacterium]|nr:16S rRNA (cytidine(1402)-2'-O)-methyltransferase [Paracoccaceae bacterium]